MVNCAKCNKKIGIFERKYDFEDEKGKPIKYCGNCNDEWNNKEQKRKLKEEEKRRKEAIKNEKERKEKDAKLNNDLETDVLIIKFCEQYPALSLSINPSNFKDLKSTIIPASETGTNYYGLHDEYQKFVKILESNRLSDFLEVFKCNIKGLREIYFHKDTRFSNTDVFDKNPKLGFIAFDFLSFFETEEIIKFLKLLEIIMKKYGDIKISNLLSIIYNNAKNKLNGSVKDTCDRLATKEKIFHYIIENEESFLQGNARFWYNEYMKLFLEYLAQNKLIRYNSLDELRAEINATKKSIELSEFENELLNPNIPKYSIEDVDMMNGFEFESFLATLFSNMDYKVQQTKLSGDQGADLIIERNKKLTVVQAKCYSGKISNKAVQEVVASIKHYQASGGIIVTNSYFAPSAIKLADSNEIRLIDRDKLKELIKKYMNINEQISIETTSTFNLDKNTLEIKCPKCEFAFTYTLDPNKKSFVTSCPKCNSQISFSLKDKFTCPNCNKKIDTLREIKDHLKSCKKAEIDNGT